VRLPASWDNFDELHHPLVFVIEDVAVKHELTDVPLVSGPDNDLVALFCEYRVSKHSNLIAVLPVIIWLGALSSLDNRLPLRIQDPLDLERIDVNMKGMIDRGGHEGPLIHVVESEGPVDAIRVEGLVIDPNRAGGPPSVSILKRRDWCPVTSSGGMLLMGAYSGILNCLSSSFTAVGKSSFAWSSC
jgi:hypothetical protein